LAPAIRRAGVRGEHGPAGGNITGSSDTLPERVELRFELLKEAIPTSRGSLSFNNSTVSPDRHGREAAHHLGLTPCRSRRAGLSTSTSPFRWSAAIDRMPWSCCGPLTFAARHRIARLGLLDQVPVVFGWREFMDADGFMAYGGAWPPSTAAPRARWTRSSRERGRASCPSRSRASSS